MRDDKRTLFHRILVSPVTTITAFALAAVLLLGSGIGGARAALEYYSEDYTSRVQMYDIGVTLVENGSDVAYRNYNSSADGTWSSGSTALLANTLADAGDTQLKIGKKYPEVITVRNSGTINQFVRVSIVKYWADPDGNKIDPKNEKGLYATTALTPDLIDLHFTEDGSWVRDDDACTVDEGGEREVYYYTKVLTADSETDPLTDTLLIDALVGKTVNQTITKNGNRTTIKTTYTYDGYSFSLEAEVDAVQDHNGEDAIKSAWGRSVTVSGSDDSKTLALN